MRLLLLSVLFPCMVLAAPLDGVWTAGGGSIVVILQERADGRVIGYFPGSAGTSIAGGSRVGSTVTVNFRTEDTMRVSTSVLTGTLTGATLDGSFASDGGSTPITLTQSSEAFSFERWNLAPSSTDGQILLNKVRHADGRFAAGGWIGVKNCRFMACGGRLSSWTITGINHSFSTSSGGSCPQSTLLTATLDAATRVLEGTHSTTTCTATTTGSFFGGKAGIADVAQTQQLLQTLAQLADAIEAESMSAADAFALTYLNDGQTKADISTLLANLYANYNHLQVDIESVDQLITASDSETHPFFAAPPRVEWQMTVKGEPASGGASTTVLAVSASLDPDDDESVYWLGQEAGRTVFVGNGYGATFELQLPVAAGDTAANLHGIWPFGIHDPSHLEGHPGIDFEYAAGAKVRAAADGTVASIVANPSHPGSWNMVINHRYGRRTLYNELSTLDVPVGASVSAGDPIGNPNSYSDGGVTRRQIHFGMQIYTDSVCPLDFLTPAELARFNTLWPAARYSEELAEPYPCNAIDVAFPYTRTWARSTGGLSATLEFIRTDPSYGDYLYQLRDSTGLVTESGSLIFHNPHSLPYASMQLLPSGGGAIRYGIYNLQADVLNIDWRTGTPPTDLSGATQYRPAVTLSP